MVMEMMPWLVLVIRVESWICFRTWLKNSVYDNIDRYET